MKRRSGEAQAALGRKAGPMKHRLEPRGGSRVEEWEYPESDEPEVACCMKQPTDSEGDDLGGPNLDHCPRPATHRSKIGFLPMCDWHAEYYRKLIGSVVKLPPAT